MRTGPIWPGAAALRFVQRYSLLVLSLPMIAACTADRPEPLVLSEPAATFNGLIDERGTLTYLSRSYSDAGVQERSENVAGLVVMRQPDEMRPIGRSYYDDGFGNLVRFGAFKAPALGGASRYALTFRRNGGIQLAFDLRDDAVVDLVVDLGLDGRLSGLADPDLQWFLDCISEHTAAGANLADAASACLARAGEAGGGGGGGLRPDVARDLDRLKDPDCTEQGGVPGSIAQGGTDGTITIKLDNGDRIKATVEENADGSSTMRIEIHDSQGRLVYQETSTFDASGSEKHTDIHRVTYDDVTGAVSHHYERRDHGKTVEDQTLTFHPAELEQEPRPARRPGGGRNQQPGPLCEECPVEDPRCAPAPNDIASLWDCQAETDFSLLECLKRMQDAIYTATGGRCSVEPGQDDRPGIRCADQQLAECLASGQSVADCLRKNPGYGGGDDGTPGPENDYLRDRIGGSKGTAGLFIDSTPMAGVYIAFCREGVEQFCRGGGRF